MMIAEQGRKRLKQAWETSKATEHTRKVVRLLEKVGEGEQVRDTDLRSLLTAKAMDELSRVSEPSCVLGVDVQGEPICINLDVFPSILVETKPRGGKTNLVMSLLAQLCLLNAPEELYIGVLDPNPVSELATLNVEHLDTVASSRGSIFEYLTYLTNERLRERLMRLESYTGLSEYNQRNPDYTLPYMVIVVSNYREIYEMLSSELNKELADKAVGMLQRLVTEGRRCGIYVIMEGVRADEQEFEQLRASFELGVSRYAELLRVGVSSTEGVTLNPVTGTGVYGVVLKEEYPVYCRVVNMPVSWVTTPRLFEGINALWS